MSAIPGIIPIYTLPGRERLYFPSPCKPAIPLEENPPVLSLENYMRTEANPSPRLKGLWYLGQIKASLGPYLPISVPEVVVFPRRVLEEYLLSGGLSADTCRRVQNAVESLQDPLHPHFSLRHAISVPGQPHARLDAINKLTHPEEAVAGVIQMADRFAANGWSKIPGSRFAVFAQQFADPPEIRSEITRETIVPAGGVAHIAGVGPDGSLLIRIIAVLGDNAAVEKTPPDEISLCFNPQTGSVDVVPGSQIVCHKPVMFLERGGPGNFIEVPLPPEMQSLPAISVGSDLDRIAHVLALLHQATSGEMNKVEFSLGPYPGKGRFYGPVFNEAGTIKSRETEKVVIRDQIDRVLTSLFDVETLMAELADKHSGLVVLNKPVFLGISPRFSMSPDFDEAIRRLRQNRLPLYFFCPGQAATAHRGRNVTDGTSHRIFYVGTRTVSRGDEVETTIGNGDSDFENKSRNIANNALVDLEEAVAAGAIGRQFIGGKAAGLAFLMRRGYNVPKTFILTVNFFDSLIRQNNLSQAFAGLKGSRPTIEKSFKALRAGFKAIPANFRIFLTDLIRANLPESSTIMFAVRSNAPFEDLGEQTFAGMMRTDLNVSWWQLGDVILACMASPFSEPVQDTILASDQKRRLLEEMAVPLIVQEMIASRCSGTVFDGDPTIKNKDLMVMEVQNGQGGAVDSKDHRPKLTIKYDKKHHLFENIILTIPSQEGADSQSQEQHLSPEDLMNPSPEISHLLPCITYGEIIDLLSKTMAITTQMRESTGRLNTHADVEFAIGPPSSKPNDPSQTWLLQARPFYL